MPEARLTEPRPHTFPLGGASRRTRLVLLLGGLTLVGLALRLATIGQSLYGDETFTYSIVTRESPGGILHTLQDSAITPPLHYMLAWATVQLGDPTFTVRLPSLLFGTATVPLVYLLGLRTVGRGAGLVAAAVMALSPFAIFYSTEARNYGTLVFLVTLSTLALLEALDSSKRRWWIVFVLTAAAVLYCHYTGGFVLIAEGAWALVVRPDKTRPLMAAYAAVALLYLPWLPSFLKQGSTNGVDAINLFSPLSPHYILESTGRVALGHPFVTLGDLPGPPGLALFAAAAIAILTGLVLRFEELRRLRPSPRLTLIVLLVLATPAGAVMYSLLRGSSIYVSRNLIASLPAACLALGALLIALDRRARVVAIALVIAAFAVGALTSLDSAYRRPPVNEAAKFVNAHAQRGDVAVQLNLFGLPVAYPLVRAYADRSIPVVEVAWGQKGKWDRLARHRRVYVVGTQLTGWSGPLGPPPVGPRLRLERTVTWDGFADVSVFVYRPVAGGSPSPPS